jgi:major membrane immunogen (membrane-anchored lipoprotein)
MSKIKLEMGKINTFTGRTMVIISMILMMFGLIMFGCAHTPLIGGPIKHEKLNDGVYEGSYRGGPNKASVSVTIKDKKIFNIEITEHQAWKGKKAELPILKRILETQSTRVDAVSGATNSSRVIMNAVQKAMEKAYKN